MKITLLIVLSFFIFGCTAKKLAVDNADGLLSYQIQKRLPLSASQEDELDSDIIKFLTSTKPQAQSMLPVIDEIQLDNDPKKIDSQYKQLETFFRKIAANFSQLMSKYMAKLDPKQQKTFFKTLKKENLDIKKKDSQDRLEDIEERFKMFLGNLSSEQKNILKGYRNYFNNRTETRLKNRQALHDEFKVIYQQDISPEQREKLFQNAFLKYQEESFRSTRNLEIIKDLLPTISPKQREHFREHAQQIKELLKYFIQVDY